MFQTTATSDLYRPMMSLWATSRPLPAPSARVIDGVLQCGDVEVEREDGLVGIDLSARGLIRLKEQGFSASELARAKDLTVLWDPKDEQIVRVLDRAPLRNLDPGPGDEFAYAAARQRGFPRAFVDGHRLAA